MRILRRMYGRKTRKNRSGIYGCVEGRMVCQKNIGEISVNGSWKRGKEEKSPMKKGMVDRRNMRAHGVDEKW